MESRVKARKEPIEEKSWAWVMDLRANNKTKTEYAVNPFAEVYCLHENVYSIFTESVDGMGEPWCHLIAGPEKAMLIDTSFGVGDLKGVCDKITGGKPLIVVNTHPHIDHTYGNCQFDRVYCHEFAAPVIEKQKSPQMWDHLFDENGEGIWFDFKKSDIMPYRDYEVVGCENNHVFDLGGGHEVELIFMPGHAAGGCCFLDKKNRILFAGDAIITMRVGVGGARPGIPYGEYATVTAFRNELAKLVPRLDEFDTVFSGHFTCGMPAIVVKNMLDACNAVVADPNCHDYTEMSAHGAEQKMKKVEGLGVLAYRDASV